MSCLRFIGAALALGCASMAANAGFVAVVEQPSSPGTVHPDVAAARTTFRNNLINIVDEPFTTISHPGDPSNCGVDGGSGDAIPIATAVGTMAVDTSGPSYACLVIRSHASQGSGELGRFDTTNPADAPGDRRYAEWLHGFTLTFARDVEAFGLYFTDMNDFGVSVTMCMTPADGSPDTCDTLGAGTDGNVGFWGFSDPSNLYRSVTFLQTLNGNLDLDAIGFDDMFIGDVRVRQPPGVPEPGSLALGGLALLSLAGLRRRRRG